MPEKQAHGLIQAKTVSNSASPSYVVKFTKRTVLRPDPKPLLNLRWLMRAVVRLGFKGLLLGLLWMAYWVRLALKKPTWITIGAHGGLRGVRIYPFCSGGEFLKSEFRRADYVLTSYK